MASGLTTPKLMGVSLVNTYLQKFQPQMRYDRLDKKTASIAINGIYQRLGLQAPVVVWCEGPTQFLNSPWILAALLNHNDDVAFRGRLLDLLVRNSNCKLPGVANIWATAKELLMSELVTRGGIGASLHERLTPIVMKKLYSDLSTAADPLIDNPERVHRTVRQTLVRFTDGLRDAMALAIVRMLSSQTRFAPEFYAPVGDNWMSRVIRSAGAELMPWTLFNQSWAARELAWLITFDAVAEFIDRSVFSDELCNQLADWMLVLRSGLAYAFFEHVCFICCYPSIIEVDEGERWHNDSSPSLQFADGSKLYFFHGVAVPEAVIVKKARTTVAMINRQENVEVRRVMIELYGLERYLRKSRAKKIQKDECGTLYRQNLRNDAPLVVVEVVNSTPEPDGTSKRYFLRVPPESPQLVLPLPGHLV